MKYFLTSLISIAAGVGIGVLATKKYYSEKYEELANEEIESVKEKFHSVNNETTVKEEVEPDENKVDVHDKTSLDEYKTVLKNYNYSSHDKPSPKELIEETEETEDPIVISPTEFGDIEDYDQVTLYYFADKILTDDMEVPVEDVWDTVGLNALETFGTYEDDCVHVVNHRLKCYFEIITDLRNYSDVAEEKEKRMRGE